MAGAANSSYTQGAKAAESNINITQGLQNNNTLLPYQELQRLRYRLSNVLVQAGQGQDKTTVSVAGQMRSTVVPNLLDVLESMSVSGPLQHLPIANSIFGKAKQKFGCLQSGKIM
ncbi:hypothetical protein LJB93_03060 [Desulfovibrio sp. OttesenSCG-928-F07]|nr:hypothetical protein [Desulfovibrio sp. OttesenSCG-928-F07]